VLRGEGGDVKGSGGGTRGAGGVRVGARRKEDGGGGWLGFGLADLADIGGIGGGMRRVRDVGGWGSSASGLWEVVGGRWYSTCCTVVDKSGRGEHKLTHAKVAAWPPGSGFPGPQAGPKPLWGRHFGLAYLGLAHDLKPDH
jgi:hypothetical protein